MQSPPFVPEQTPTVVTSTATTPCQCSGQHTKGVRPIVLIGGTLLVAYFLFRK